MKRLLPVLLALAGLPLLAGCGGEATPTPEPTAIPEAAAGGAVLTVSKPVVEFREKEMGEGELLEAGATTEVEPGANILTREGGQAMLDWANFLSQEMLTDTDSLLGLSQPETRYVVLDQATGTARYTLEGPGEPATLTIKAGWIDIGVKQGSAQFIVSLVPGAPPSAWVALLNGTAEVDRKGETVSLAAGQAAGFSEDGPLPEPMEVDSALIKTWFSDVADGSATTSIVAVAFRCEVSAASADFLAEPSAEAGPAGAPLKQGTVVEVAQRDEDGQWLRVKPLAKLELGWVESKNLACSGPISSVSTTPPGEIGAPTPTLARPTRGPLPTRAAPPVGTAPLASPTPTSTPTAAAAADISFSVDDDEITKGECTTLRWTVKNVQAYYVDGKGKAGDSGSEKVCPSSTTTYTLRVVKRDGSEESRSVTVEVNQPEPTTAPPTQPPPTQPPPAATTAAPPPEPTTPVPQITPDTPEPQPTSETPMPPAG